MEKIITYENLRSFAYVNDNVCEHPIKGIVLNFFGLGGDEMYSDETKILRRKWYPLRYSLLQSLGMDEPPGCIIHRRDHRRSV